MQRLINGFSCGIPGSRPAWWREHGYREKCTSSGEFSQSTAVRGGKPTRLARCRARPPWPDRDRRRGL